MNDQSPTTMVSVALSLYKGEPIGDRPDPEELAALYEGALSETRRAEVLSHLAGDDAVYAQWLMSFEYAEELGILGEDPIPEAASVTAGETAREDHGASFAGKLKNLFNLYTLVPGTALAGLAVFMLFFQASQPSGVEGLYQEYGVSASGQLQLPTRSLGNFWDEPEPERFVVSQGFKTGLDRLAIDASSMKLLANESEQPGTDALRDDQRATLSAVGQWAAITYVQCSGQTADYFVAAEHVWKSLRTRLDTIDTSYAENLTDRASQLDGTEAADRRVCALAGLIASDVRR
ncbi:hypothetical protein [Marinobacter sp. CHS3-4]|uniref:hypothetical protein n=1 Tax=Marinobacter sp. CHS3-4 TaxID=3045174 RepID=UPI0024B4BF94|nr:hypothetical protein [Marinobacter sp. CHS3-4]MDI9245941.1 hypothetical protein [Marinobacter sp. CHS3-4]